MLPRRAALATKTGENGRNVPKNGALPALDGVIEPRGLMELSSYSPHPILRLREELVDIDDEALM